MKRLLFLMLAAGGLYMSLRAASYDIYVDGIQVTDANRYNVLGDGKVQFIGNTMIFNNIQKTFADTFLVVGSAFPNDLKLFFNGDNRIFSQSGCSFSHHAWGNNWTGTLVTDGIMIHNGIPRFSDADMQVYGTDKSGNPTGIINLKPNNRLYLQHSTIRQSYIAGFPEIEYKESRVVTPNANYNETTRRFEDENGNRIDQVDIEAYKLYGYYADKDHDVFGKWIEIASYNATAPLNNETLFFDSTTCEFTIHNLSEQSAELDLLYSSKDEPEYAVINVQGDNNVIHRLETDLTVNHYNLHIKGNGSLDVVARTSYDHGRIISHYKDIRISDGCKINIEGNLVSGASSWEVTGTLYLDNCSLVINKCNKKKIISGFDNVVMTHCQVIYPEGAVWDSSLKAFAVNGVEVTERIEIAPINTAIKDVNAEAPNGQAYDLLGRPVDDTYHGIVIQGGKKMVQ